MAGRFPLYTDADVHGHLVDALRARDWDVIRAIEAFPEGTSDDVHFERAAELDRVLVTNDQPLRAIAYEWLREGRAFRGVITWRQRDYEKRSIGDILRDFEKFAQKEDPFGNYPIIHLPLTDVT